MQLQCCICGPSAGFLKMRPAKAAEVEIQAVHEVAAVSILSSRNENRESNKQGFMYTFSYTNNPFGNHPGILPSNSSSIFRTESETLEASRCRMPGCSDGPRRSSRPKLGPHQNGSVPDVQMDREEARDLLPSDQCLFLAKPDPIDTRFRACFLRRISDAPRHLKQTRYHCEFLSSSSSPRINRDETMMRHSLVWGLSPHESIEMRP